MFATVVIAFFFVRLGLIAGLFAAEAALLSASKAGTAVVLGSFYLAGAALKVIKDSGE